MNAPEFEIPPKATFDRRWLLIFFLIAFLICSSVTCIGFSRWEILPFHMLGQDCGTGSVVVKGRLIDHQSIPVFDAKITVHLKELGCPNSLPMSDLILTSDNNGQFEGKISGLTAMDIFTLSVVAPGCSDQFQDYYGDDFLKELNISMYCSQQIELHSVK